MLVADADLLFGQALGRVLRREPGLAVVDEHPTSGLDTAVALGRYQPDIAVIDWWLRDTEAPAMAEMAATVSPESKLLFLSWFHPGRRALSAALEAGATAVLSKKAGIRDLVELIDSVSPPPKQPGRAGKAVTEQPVVSEHKASPTSPWNEELWAKLSTLTGREVEVLRVVGGGQPVKQIARSLGITVGTARSHIHQILIKTGTTSTSEAALLAESVGLTFEVPPPSAAAESVATRRHMGAKRVSPGETTARVVVLVADSQRLFAEALGPALEDEGDVVYIGPAPTTTESMLAAAVRHCPDVVLVDRALQPTGGPDAVRALKRWVPECRILMLASGPFSPDDVTDALTAGAVAFLPKTLPLDQVASAVRRAHAGEDPVFGDQMLAMVEGIAQRAEGFARLVQGMESLSAREVEVLTALANSPDRVLIARRLGCSEGTLRNHVAAILNKTGARTAREAVVMARLSGLFGKRR